MMIPRQRLLKIMEERHLIVNPILMDNKFKTNTSRI